MQETKLWVVLTLLWPAGGLQPRRRAGLPRNGGERSISTGLGVCSGIIPPLKCPKSRMVQNQRYPVTSTPRSRALRSPFAPVAQKEQITR